ncbi:hypothetical protein LCGC14_2118870, partial [marine sediment metagenome]
MSRFRIFGLFLIVAALLLVALPAICQEAPA